jgi:hypothetical protein
MGECLLVCSKECPGSLYYGSSTNIKDKKETIYTHGSRKGCVTKICKGTQQAEEGASNPLGCHSKEVSDEGSLRENISFFSSLYLSLADHVHDLIPLQRSASCLERKEAHARLGQSFDETMILFDKIVEVFDLPQLHVFRQDSSGFEVGNRFRIGGMLIHIDHCWGHVRQTELGRRGDLTPMLTNCTASSRMISASKWRHLKGWCSVMTDPLLFFSSDFNRSAFFLQHSHGKLVFTSKRLFEPGRQQRGALHPYMIARSGARIRSPSIAYHGRFFH